jgi:hypothetical protein
MCGKVISISRPHDSQEMGVDTMHGRTRRDCSDEGESEGQELTSCHI